VAELRREFAIELANLDGASNVGIQLESAYVGARRSWECRWPTATTLPRPSMTTMAVLRARLQLRGGRIRAHRGWASGLLPARRISALCFHRAVQSSTAQAIATLDNMPLNSVPTFYGQNQFNTIEAYAALNMHNWQMSFGQQSCTGDRTPMVRSCFPTMPRPCRCCALAYHSLPASRSPRLAGHDPQ